MRQHIFQWNKNLKLFRQNFSEYVIAQIREQMMGSNVPVPEAALKSDGYQRGRKVWDAIFSSMVRTLAPQFGRAEKRRNSIEFDSYSFRHIMTGGIVAFFQ